MKVFIRTNASRISAIFEGFLDLQENKHLLPSFGSDLKFACIQAYLDTLKDEYQTFYPRV